MNLTAVVLAFLEEAFRSWNIDSDLATGRYGDADAMIAIAENHWIDDLRELSWKFYDECIHLVSRPFVLNPTFEGSSHVGGADADVIADGNLIEFKCTIKDQIQGDWLRQLLGYVLLDYSDKLGITGIGFYMARQGLLLQWDLEEALSKLSPGKPPTIAELRGRFREITESLHQNRVSFVRPARK